MLWTNASSAAAATIVADGIVCTLSDAIRAANTNAPAGGCVAGDDQNGGDVIDLQTDVAIELPDNIDANGCPNALPQVTTKIMIYGNGHTVRGLGSTRLFDSTQGDLTLDQITVRDGFLEFCVGAGINGVVTLIDSTVTNNFTLDRGAGVAGSSVRLIRSAVTDNRGMGLYIVGTLDATGSLIARNRGSGVNLSETSGGVEIHGTAILENTTIADNLIGGLNGIGGGLYADGDVTLVRSTVSGNIAGGDFGFGGGIFLYAGSLTVINSTIAGNTAVGNPLGTTVGGSGGGVFSSQLTSNSGPGGVVNLVHSTVTGNFAIGRWPADTAGIGGGLRVDTLHLTNTIIAGNFATVELTWDCAAQTVEFRGVNLIGDGSCFAEAEGQLTGDPLLGALADNGGPTLTHMPQAGSPLIDRIPKVNGKCGSTTINDDQRGAKRPQSTSKWCDIGAVEYSPKSFSLSSAY